MKKEFFEIVSEAVRPDESVSGLALEVQGSEGVVRFINVTPHPVIIIRQQGNLIIPPSGYLVRVSETTSKVSEVVGIDVMKFEFGEVVMPAEVIKEYEKDPENTYLVAGRITADALATQSTGIEPSHVLIPSGIVRDTNGNVVGATFFGLSNKLKK